MMRKSDVVIIGAGASGLMCAAGAARRGRSVVVLEHGAGPGAKVMASGGGRCNCTNLDMGPEHFISRNEHFVKSALARYRPEDFVVMVRRHGLGLEEKAPGQLFCRQGAGAILEMLVKECAGAGVEIVTGCEVREVERDGGYVTRTSLGEFGSASVVVSTGGLSYRNLGASGLGYDIARRFGLRVVETKPGLVPLRFRAEDREVFGGLSGIAVRAGLRLDDEVWVGDVLFTLKGLSGPAVLRMSSHWREGRPVYGDFLPGLEIEDLLRELSGNRMLVRNYLDRHLPARLAAVLSGGAGERRGCDLDGRSALELANGLKKRKFVFTGTAGFAMAEVTIGGVDTRELSSKSMEAAKARGLYFTGEVMDVSGDLGGYNLQWAWSSGHAAGEYA